MKDNLKIFLLRSWVIGMVVVVVHMMMGFQHLAIGLFLGIINAFVVDLFYLTIRKGNTAKYPKGWKLLLNTAINIIIAVGISLIIRLIDLWLIEAGLVKIPIEPFRYIAFYQIIYYGVRFLYIEIKRIFERKKHESNS